MSDQTTPRTVEEADVLAHLRWLVEQGRGWADDRTHTSFMAVRDALLQAARMPSVEAVAEVLCEPRHRAVPPPSWPVRPVAPHCPACAAKAERVVALWGAP